MRPLRVYLDSSDYSTLSDLKRRTETAPGVLEQLRRWVAEEKIACYFSGIHITEMAPLTRVHSAAAKRRADVLVGLCGRNSLISLDRLIARELHNALGDGDSLPCVYSHTGDWYPEGVGDMSPVGLIAVESDIRKEIRDNVANRKARRQLKRNLFRKGKLRADAHATVVSRARTVDVDAVLRELPMRPQDARTLLRYVVGDATAREASDAFLESLRDPSWMMLWFVRHHEELTPFIKWVRGPSSKFLPALHQMAEVAASLRMSDAQEGTNLVDECLSAKMWKEHQDNLLQRIANEMVRDLVQRDGVALSPEAIDDRCPGLSVGFRSHHSACWTVTSGSPRKPKESDLADALHAVYAPYVDIFRADKFMAPFIERHLCGLPTRVVSKLSSLVSVIQQSIDVAEDHL